MLRFLREIRQRNWSKAVLGNVSADMDSVFGALALAYCLSEVRSRQIRGIPILPLVNIPREDLPLRTEIVSTLKESGVNLDLLTFVSEVDIADKGLILYDHNQLAHEQKQ
jgi:exopolyphosphatase